MIAVVNVLIAPAGSFVYCGRYNATYRLPASPLANPYHLAREADRPAVLAQYATWFETMTNSDNPAFHAEIARLVNLARAGDLALGCWCKPKACHCDVIKGFLEVIG
jgi:hypothetical protein